MRLELKKMSKKDVEKRIRDFFEKESFTSIEVKKIKRLAMKYNIKLGNYRRFYCKKCLSQLRGKTRITKTHKTIECEKCRYKNKFRIQ